MHAIPGPRQRALFPLKVTTPSAWQPPLDAWLGYLSAARPASTLYLREYHLRRFAASHPDPWAVDLDELGRWLGAHGWAPETRRSYRSSLRSFYQWARATGRLEADPTAELLPIRVPRGEARPAPDAVYRAAVASADDRVALMLELGRQAGLRRGEIARVHSGDVEADLVGWTLRVTGKGGVVRRVPMLDDLARRLRALPTGYAFPGQIDGHLSPAYVGKLMSRALDPGWTAHGLRHSFASAAHEASGHDLPLTQSLLGHASIETTRRYVLVDDASKRAAVLRGAA
jgi:integrase